MKVQDVLLLPLAKKITWWQAAEIYGISDRHMRRWWERYEEVLALYREKYFDLNVQHFHEKLQADRDRVELQLVTGNTLSEVVNLSSYFAVMNSDTCFCGGRHSNAANLNRTADEPGLPLR